MRSASIGIAIAGAAPLAKRALPIYIRAMTHYQVITSDDVVSRTGAIKLYGP
jgi:hypothetical protein